MTLARSQEEIDEQINAAVESHNRWPGMTYEDGVDAALRWVTGESASKPMEDE